MGRRAKCWNSTVFLMELKYVGGTEKLKINTLGQWVFGKYELSAVTFNCSRLIMQFEQLYTSRQTERNDMTLKYLLSFTQQWHRNPFRDYKKQRLHQCLDDLLLCVDCVTVTKKRLNSTVFTSVLSNSSQVIHYIEKAASSTEARKNLSSSSLLFVSTDAVMFLCLSQGIINIISPKPHLLSVFAINKSVYAPGPCGECFHSMCQAAQSMSHIWYRWCTSQINQPAGLYTGLICAVWPSNPDWGVFSTAASPFYRETKTPGSISTGMMTWWTGDFVLSARMLEKWLDKAIKWPISVSNCRLCHVKHVFHCK